MTNNLSKAKKILIYGFAREGKSSVEFFKKHFPEIKIDIHDDNIKKFAKKKNFSQYDLILVSPGISRNIFPRSVQGNLSSNTELFFENLPMAMRQRVIGITGTKGKSTTTKLLAETLRSAGKKVMEAGNYGTAVLDSFDGLTGSTLDYVVCELSSYQLENLKISPGIAVFLNIYPDHLDRHGTLAKYFKAKSSIWRYQEKGDYLVVPKTILEAHKKYIKTSATVISAKPFDKSALSKDSIFRAAHFLEDFGAVEAVCKIVKVPRSILVKTAQSFKGLPHRMELVATKQGIQFYDDGNSVNPGATIKNLEFFERKLGSVILGGQNRKQDFGPLVKKVVNWGAHVIVYDSETSKTIIKELKKISGAKWSEAKTLSKAVDTAFKVTPKNKISILSPAAPSYDRFKNFQEKGRVFRQAIMKHKK